MTSHLPRFLALMLLATSVIQAQSVPRTGETLVLTNVTVIDGNGGAPKSKMTLIISGERIVDMFTTGRKKPLIGATVMDLSGHYAIPGLIDSHYHLLLNRGAAEETARHRFAFLGGITTVRDMAGDGIALAELAKAAGDANVQSPRVYFSAVMAGATWFSNDQRVSLMMHGLPSGEAAWARAIKPDTDIVKAVTEAKNTGATGIKLYADLSPDTVVQITKEAHRQGLKVWSHATVFPSKPSDAIVAGVDVISHSVMMVFELENKLPEISDKSSYRTINWKSVSVDSPAVTALLRRMRKKGTMLDDTIIHTNMRLSPDVVKTQAARPESERTPGYAIGVENWTYGITRRAHKLGIPIVAGTDFQEQPRTQDFPNIHTELLLLVTKCGLTPLEAITAATRNGSVALGVEKSHGTIAKGKIADLVILSANPSTDIRNTTKILYVIKGGRLHKREKVAMPAT